MPAPIVIDTETFYAPKLKYSIRSLIDEQYCRHELFDCYMISVSDGTTCWAGHPKDFIWSSLEGRVLLSHNKKFDFSVISELQRRGLAPKFTPADWHCTANLTAFLCNQRALDNAVEALYGVKVSKAERADAEGKRWPQDFTPEQQTAMLAYARRDVYWPHKIWTDHSDKWSEEERILSNLTIDQGLRGIQVDVSLLNQFICDSHEMKMNTEKMIPWMEDPDDEDWDDFKLSPTSAKCIAEQCRRSGIPCCPVKAESEEAYDEWETTYAPQHPWITAVTAWRSINKLYKAFLLMKSRVRPDGTMPFGLKYWGAHTGRWSGDNKINFQNMRRYPAFGLQSGLLQQNDKTIAKYIDYNKAPETKGQWPSEVRFALDFRALFIPRPGKKMIVSDLAQIEPRVLAWLSGNHQMIEQVRSGVSVYEAFARANFGYTGGKMDKSTNEYKLIKIQVLQLGYQAGAEKFITTALKESGMDLTENDPEFEEVEDIYTGVISKVPGHGAYARKLVRDFRAASPLTTALWQRLDEGFRSSVGADFVMTLPNGRKMTYRNVRAQGRMEKSKKDGKPYMKTEYTAEVGYRRVPSYGGKLTENIVQAVARDFFASTLVRMHQQRLPILFTSHDEAIMEVDQSVQAADIEHAMSIAPDWAPGFPLAAEAKEVKHYLK